MNRGVVSHIHSTGRVKGSGSGQVRAVSGPLVRVRVRVRVRTSGVDGRPTDPLGWMRLDAVFDLRCWGGRGTEKCRHNMQGARVSVCVFVCGCVCVCQSERSKWLCGRGLQMQCWPHTRPHSSGWDLTLSHPHPNPPPRRRHLNCASTTPPHNFRFRLALCSERGVRSPHMSVW